jgi:hypothetical protein
VRENSKSSLQSGKIPERTGEQGLNNLRNKLGRGKDRQGLKPGFLGIVYGPTKVVP